MSDSSDAKKKSRNSPQPPKPPVDAYELADEPAPPKAPPADAAGVNRSYLIDTGAPTADGKPADPDAQRFASARKMMLGDRADATVAPEKIPLEQPPPVDSATLARRREEARRKAAEEWGEQLARQRKRKLITLGMVVLVLAVVYFWVNARINGGADAAATSWITPMMAPIV